MAAVELCSSLGGVLEETCEREPEGRPLESSRLRHVGYVAVPVDDWIRDIRRLGKANLRNESKLTYTCICN